MELNLLPKKKTRKNIMLITICLYSFFAQAQNVGIGTTTPAARPDVAGLNHWDLAGTEGDVA
ncbi:MAG: hypothetical protein JWP81_748 [Ferruginibacter sp.]|nr:hypothetical protein [Ferruginibacter sp.]